MAIDINTLMPVAQVQKSYGTEGGMTISLFTSIPKDIYLKEPVFIIYDELPVPFFITSFSPKGNGKALVTIEDIENLEQAEALSGKQLLMEEKTVHEEEEEEEIYDEYSLACHIIGFLIKDQNGREIGHIDEVYDFSGNVCIEVSGHMIPFHLDLLIKLDEKKETLSMNIPEGLI